jgi:hypothetical protein
MDELRGRLEQALAATYVFQRELGGGGMSRTYLAVEQSHNRRVVVKVASWSCGPMPTRSSNRR